MFPNRAVNKTSPIACGLGAGDWAGSHFHTGWPDLDSRPSENSSRARAAHEENKEEGKGKTEEIEPSSAPIPERERGRERKEKRRQKTT